MDALNRDRAARIPAGTGSADDPATPPAMARGGIGPADAGGPAAVPERLPRHPRHARSRVSAAIERSELVFHYQPIVELRTGRVAGAEALARWYDPCRGLLLPARWIDAVEQDPGLVSELGRHGLRSAMHRLRAWHAGGRPLSVSVNVGARHLLSDRFVEDVRGALATAPELSGHLVLEVTESALIDDFSRACRMLSGCRELGARVAIDDFGTGQASLSYLLELSADYIKLDRRFVLRMLSDCRAFGIVVATLQGSSMLGIEAVAEGVETAAQHRCLGQLGCRYAQGFGFTQALSPVAFDRWLRKRGRSAPRSDGPAPLLTDTQTRMLSSLILHRSRHAALPGTVATDDARGGVSGPGAWSASCALAPGADGCGHRPADRELSGRHRRLHRLERVARQTLKRSGALPAALRTEVGRALAAYEEAVEAALSGANPVRGGPDPVR